MRKIVLVCSAGASTSMMVNRMIKAAQEMNYECSIEAMPVNCVKDKTGGNVDCILLGPQVKFMLESVKAEFPNVPVEAIDMLDYGMMNGKNVLEFAKSLIGD